MLLILHLALLVGAVYAQDWELVWQEEFDGDSLDESKWGREVTAWGGGNAEFQTYVDDLKNVQVKDGRLFLQATKLSENTNPLTGQPYGDEFLNSGTLNLVDLYGYCTSDNDSGCYRTGQDIPPIASGRVHTNGKFSFRYGLVQINAKMPKGDWLWPAMWLMPQGSKYGGWPRSGEIDIVEITGNVNYECNGNPHDIRHMGSAMHWGPTPGENMYHLTTASLDMSRDYSDNFGDFFHVFSLEWTGQGIEFMVDDRNVMTRPWPPMSDRDAGDCWTGFFNFAFPQGGPQDPWTDDLVCDKFMAPFDQPFYIILNLAVGGRWYIPDNCVNAGAQKPWTNGGSQRDMMQDFYSKQDDWKPTWDLEGELNAMQVDWIRVYQHNDMEGSWVPDHCPSPPNTEC